MESNVGLFEDGLQQSFDVKNPSKIETELERKIQDRLLNGFTNWNKGYDAWCKWCDTLYEPDACYNIRNQHFTLEEYKMAMKYNMEEFTVELKDFDNIIIRDDWCAIRYTVTNTNRKTGEAITSSVMEFVHFKDNPDPIGARVIEGWAR